MSEANVIEFPSDTLAKLRKWAITIGENVKPIVERIEAEPELTRDRYDAYLSAITVGVDAMRLTVGPNAYQFIGAALIHAGGNRRGIEAALRILGALD